MFKKLGITLVLSLITLFLFSQSFLKKYSYRCSGIDSSNSLNSGTCFFIQENSKIFLISAYHFFLISADIEGDSHINRLNIEDAYGQFRFKITVKLDTFFNLDNLHYSIPDFRCVQIEIPNDIKINFINDLIDVTFLSLTPDEIYVYGYPVDKQKILSDNAYNYYTQNSRYDLLRKYSPSVQLIKSKYANYSNYLAYYSKQTPTKSSKKEEMQLFITNTKRWHFLIELKKNNIEGYSGSPVFGKFTAKDGQILYKFMGILTAGNENLMVGICQKGQLVITALKL